MNATETSARLAQNILTLCQTLLPNGHREGSEWVVGSPKGEEGETCLVHLGGEKAGVWCDFNGGAERGDALGLVKAVYGYDLKTALAWAHKWLGIEDPPPEDLGTIAYNYVDEAGTLLFQVCKKTRPEKRFWQRQPDGNGDWKRGEDGKLTMKGARYVPYHLDRLVAARQNANGHPPRVYICEGEKDVDNLAAVGFLTTTNAGGASTSRGKSKWREDYNQFFAGFDVVILPDNDEAGRVHAQHVAANLAPVAHAVRIVELPGLPEKGDVTDWINAAKRTNEDLEALVEATPLWVPGPATIDDAWELDEEKRIISNSQHNIRLALHKLDVKLRHNIFADRTLVGSRELKERALDDPRLNRLWLQIDEVFRFRPTIEFFRTVVDDTARRNEFHPVLDYLDSRPWNGEYDLLDNWLFRYGGVKERKGDEKYNQYVRAVGRIALVAAVRRLRQPGCKFDEMLVLVNETQGTDKSEALRTLAVCDEWFTDSIDLGAKDKEAIEQTQGKWIVEIPEMRGRRRNDVDRIKAFMSRAADRARLAYGRLPTEVPRQSIYFGSANDIKFLRDRSGNRRFWPIIGVIFDIAALRRDVDQLWAQAVAAEKTGESIRLAKNLWAIAESVQTESLEEEPWVEVLNTAFDDLEGKIRAANVWIILDIDVARRDPDADNRMGHAMRELGWARKQRRYGDNPEWSYIKGNGEEQIFTSRDLESGMLRISQGNKTWTIGRGETYRRPL
jgi:predicted P-loop ATPase